MSENHNGGIPPMLTADQVAEARGRARFENAKKDTESTAGMLREVDIVISILQANRENIGGFALALVSKEGDALLDPFNVEKSGDPCDAIATRSCLNRRHAILVTEVVNASLAKVDEPTPMPIFAGSFPASMLPPDLLAALRPKMPQAPGGDGQPN